MSKKDKKAEKKAAKKEAKAAAKKAKKDKLKKIAEKPEALAEELRAQSEAVLAVDESLAEDAVAVVEQKQAPAPKKAKAAANYTPVEGDKLRTVSIKMPVSLIEAADKAAAVYGGEGISRSEFIRVAIEKLVNE